MDVSQQESTKNNFKGGYGTRLRRHAENQALLKDNDVRFWYLNIKNGAAATGDSYLRGLGVFCERTGVTAQQLLKMKNKYRDNLIAGYVPKFGKGATAYAVKVLRSFFAQFPSKRIVLRPVNLKRIPRPRVDKMHIPEVEELGLVLRAAGDLRAKAAISITAFGGQRLEVLGNYDGTDGLKLGDFPEAKFEDGKFVSLGKAPVRFIVRQELSKKDFQSFSFIGPEGTEYVTKYLIDRAASGEVLTKDSPLIAPKQPQRQALLTKKHPRQFIRQVNISDILRKVMRKVPAMNGNPPNIWRSYFVMHTDMSPWNKDEREFCANHQGDISAVYGLHKPLPPIRMEEIRKGYASALPFLEPSNPEREVAARLSKIEQGIREQQPQPVKVGPEQQPQPVRVEHKVVTRAELQEHVGFGWRFVADLRDGSYIIER